MSTSTNTPPVRGIRRNATETVAFQVITYSLTIVQGIVIARALGPTGRGVFYLATLCTALFLTFFGGLNSAVAYPVSKKDGTSGDIMSSGAILSLLLASLPVTAVILAHRYWVSSDSWFGFSAAAAIVGLFVACFNGFFLGGSDIRGLNLSQVITGSLSLGLIAVFVLGLRMGIQSALASWVIASALTVAWMWRRSGLTIRELLQANVTKNRVWNLLSFTIRIGVANSMAFLNFRADSFLVERYAGVKALGIYSVAVGIAEVPWFISRAISTAAYGRLGRESASGASQLAAKAFRHTGAAVLLLAIAIAVASPLVLPLIYGPAFREAVPILWFLLPGNVCYGLASVMSAYFTNHLGRPGISSFLAGTAVVIELAGCFILIPRFGLIGAALASSIAYTLSISIACLVFVRLAELDWRKHLIVSRSDFAEGLHMVRGLFARIS